MKNHDLNNLSFETAKIVETLNDKQQEIFFKYYNKNKLKKPFLYFCLFFGYSHNIHLGRPLYTWLGLIAAILIPYSLTLLIIVDIFRLPKMIRVYNSHFANNLVNRLKKDEESFNYESITTANYSLKEVLTHALFNFPKKTTPVILGIKEKVISAIIWLSLISALFYNALNYSLPPTTNNSVSKTSTKKSIGKAAECSEKQVVNLFEKLAGEILVQEAQTSSVYIDNTYDIEEYAYNPKLDMRTCRAKVKVTSGAKESQGLYTTFLVEYTTTSNRVEVSPARNWVLL